MNSFLMNLARLANQYENLLDNCHVASLLLDEDFNAHAFIAAWMQSKQRHVFCISHANMALECRLAESERNFAQSFTFVHGDHEKETYLDRGWSTDQVIVTGSPRYDRLIKMTGADKVVGTNNASPRILYCAGLLWNYSPDVLGFLGCDVYGFRRSQEATLRFLLRTAQNSNFTVVIKPHYAEDEQMWRDLARNENSNCKVEVVKASEDYFKLLKESDAMALCLWSSTLIEAGIAQVPVFYIDLDGQNSRHVSRLESEGLCKIIRTEDDFKQALKKITPPKSLSQFNVRSTTDPNYFLGTLDGQASQRVVDFICNKLKSTSHV